MKLLISGTSFLLPKNSAWSKLSDNYELSFSDYGNWEKDLITCKNSDALVIIIFFEDVFNTVKKEEDIKSDFHIFLSLLEKRLNKAINPTIVMFSNLYKQNLIKSSKTISIGNKINNWFFEELESFGSKFVNLFFVNLNNEFSLKGLDYFTDQRNWYFANCRLSINGLFLLSDLISRILKRYDTPASKVLILDCDNTLWGGVIGEDGIKNILLGQDGVGKAYLEFQKAIKKISDEGILLAIASKNDELDVFNVFQNHSNMVIKRNDIISWKINWKEKSENIISISNDLSLGLDSFVFWDDNPIERNKVKIMLPSVKTLDIPENIYDWGSYLESLDLFANFNFTNEDINKKKQYFSRSKFISDKNSITDEKSYLKSINLKPVAHNLSEDKMDRAVQLCSKTNQFNLRTKRHKYSDLSKMNKTNSELCFIASLEDKYGDHGLVGLLCLTEINKDYIFLDTLLLSCRILGRHLEAWMLKEALKRSIKFGYKYIIGEYIASKRNTIVKEFLIEHGFEKISNNKLLKEKLGNFIKNKNLYFISTKKTFIPNGDIYD